MKSATVIGFRHPLRGLNHARATNPTFAHLMRLMRRISRTALLLTAILVATLLASEIASRWKESSAIPLPGALSAADTEDAITLRPVTHPPASASLTPSFDVFKIQSRK